MSRKKKILVKDVEPLVKECQGNIAAVARKLKVSWSTVDRRVKESKSLQMAVKEAREASLDLAESKLEEKIREGNLTAIIFKLKTQGADRGYSQRHEITGKAGKPIKSESKSEVKLDTEGQAEAILKAVEAKRKRE